VVAPHGWPDPSGDARRLDEHGQPERPVRPPLAVVDALHQQTGAKVAAVALDDAGVSADKVVERLDDSGGCTQRSPGWKSFG
jgi:hypothetical protein